MQPIPLPSRVHYELLLQLLERKSLAAANEKPDLRNQIQQLIFTLRKAMAQQKQLEAICEQTYVPFEYRWSLNSASGMAEDSASKLPIPSAAREPS